MATADFQQHQLHLFDPKTGRPTTVLDGPADLKFVQVSPNGRWVATGAREGKDAAVFDLASKQIVKRIRVGRQVSVGFSPDSKYLICGGNRIFNLATWEVSFIASDADLRTFFGPIFPRSGDFGVFTSRFADGVPAGSIMLVNTGTWRPIASLRSHPDVEETSPYGLTPDGGKLLVHVRDIDSGRLELWNLAEVRRHLAKLELDWELPPLTAKTPDSDGPTEFVVDMGELVQSKDPDVAEVSKPIRKSFPGNDPTTVRANENGSFTLLPKDAEVYGTTLVFDQHGKIGPLVFKRSFGSFGHWRSNDDHVVWTLNVQQAGRYAVTLEYARKPVAEGKQFALTVGDNTLSRFVPATSSWDDYEVMDVGHVELLEGHVQLTIRPNEPIHSTLMKLKNVELTLAEGGSSQND